MDTLRPAEKRWEKNRDPEDLVELQKNQSQSISELIKLLMKPVELDFLILAMKSIL